MLRARRSVAQASAIDIMERQHQYIDILSGGGQVFPLQDSVLTQERMPTPKTFLQHLSTRKNCPRLNDWNGMEDSNNSSCEIYLCMSCGKSSDNMAGARLRDAAHGCLLYHVCR